MLGTAGVERGVDVLVGRWDLCLEQLDVLIALIDPASVFRQVIHGRVGGRADVGEHAVERGLR